MSSFHRCTVFIVCILLASSLACAADSATSVDARVDALLKQMTLEEKVAQMDMFFMHDLDSPANRDLQHSIGVGFARGDTSAEKSNALQADAAKTRLGIPIISLVNACHGDAMRSGATVFPTNISIAATFNTDLAHTTAMLAAREIRAFGNQWTFTPTIDVTQDARFGRTGESFGECPFVNSAMADAYVRGYQGSSDPSQNVAACAKHFVGGGISEGGVNHATAEISERTLRTVFLKPFKAAVDAGCMTIMAGHNDVGGIPMHANKWLLTDVLKGEFGFKGFVVSDMEDIDNLEAGKLHSIAPDHQTALEMAINAGMDVHNYSRTRKDFIDPVMDAVNQGRIPQSRIDDAVRRILRVKFMLDLFEDHNLDVTKSQQETGSTEARRIALQGARESVVLLKNQNALLPLTPGKYKHIFVTGPDADNQSILGDWSAKQPDANVTTILQGIRSNAGDGSEIDYLNCGRIKGKPAVVTAESIATADPNLINQKIATDGNTISDFTIAEAGRRAAAADLCVVVVGGYGLRWEWALRTYGESCDRPAIDLYGRQLELIKAVQASGKPVVAIVVNGPPLNEPWLDDNIPAVLYSMEPGMFGGQAVGEILFGKVNPSGRLPYTIPKNVGQVPMFYYMRHSRYWTGYGLGTSRADDKPAWEFGFGLSYTTFSCSNLATPAAVDIGSDVPVSVTVTNTGPIAGDDSVLLFTSAKYQSVAPALKELKGFTKIHLDAGQSKTVTMTIKSQDLAIWNAEMKQVIEPTEYKITIGNQTGKFVLRDPAAR